MMSKYEQAILDGWEDVHKRSQLSLWILLALKDGPKHMAKIKHFIVEMTQNTISADDKSMYRALRRFVETELISFTTKPSKSGPDLKIYKLSEIGETVLGEFVKRNIFNVYFNQQFKELIK